MHKLNWKNVTSRVDCWNTSPRTFNRSKSPTPNVIMTERSYTNVIKYRRSKERKQVKKKKVQPRVSAEQLQTEFFNLHSSTLNPFFESKDNSMIPFLRSNSKFLLLYDDNDYQVRLIFILRIYSIPFEVTMKSCVETRLIL